MLELPEWARNHLAAISGFDPRSPGSLDAVSQQVLPEGLFAHAWRYEQGKLQLIRYEEDGYASIPEALARERNGLFRFFPNLLDGREPSKEFAEAVERMRATLPLGSWRGEDSESEQAAAVQGELVFLVVYPLDSFQESLKEGVDRSLDRLRIALDGSLEDLAEQGLKVDFRVSVMEQGIDAVRVETLKDDVLELSMETSLAHRECRQGEMWIGFAKLGQLLEHQYMLEKILGPGTNAMLSENIRTWLGHTPTNRSLEKAFSVMASSNTVEEFPFLHNGMTVAGLGGVSVKDGNVLRIRKPRILNGAQTLNAFRAWKEGVGKGKELDPVVFLKVIQEGVTGEDFIRRVTAANNRQNPVESSDIRAGDPIHRKLESRIEKIGWSYHYRRSWQDRTLLKDVKVTLLTMREALPSIWHYAHGRFNEARRADSIFDDETQYNECFRWFLGESESQSLQRLKATALFWSGFRRLKQLRLYDNAGEVSHPVGEIKSNQLRPVELRDRYQGQVKILACVILLMRWIKDKGIEPLWELRDRGWAPFEEALREDLGKLARKSEFKEVFANLLVTDPRFRKEQEIEHEDGKEMRITWNGLPTDKGFDAAMQLLIERDAQWKWNEW